MIEHPEITHIRSTGYPKYKGEVSVLDSFEINELLNSIVEKSNDLKMIYQGTDFYAEDLEEVAEELSGEVEVLIGKLQD
jgi:hypothetical protein